MPDEPNRLVQSVRPADVHMEPLEVDQSIVLEGRPEWAVAVVWRNEDSTQIAGFFRSTPGRFNYTQPANEFSVIRAGHLIITPELGDPLECRAGDFVQFRGGRTYEFDVRETFEDSFVLASSTPIEF